MRQLETPVLADSKCLKQILVPTLMKRAYLGRQLWNFFYVLLLVAVWSLGIWLQSAALTTILSAVGLLVLLSWPCHMGRVVAGDSLPLTKNGWATLLMTAIFLGGGSFGLYQVATGGIDGRLGLAHLGYVLAAGASFGAAYVVTKRHRPLVWRRLSINNYWTTTGDDILVCGANAAQATHIFQEFFNYFDVIDMDADPVVFVERAAFVTDQHGITALRVAAENSRVLILVCPESGLGPEVALVRSLDVDSNCLVLLPPTGDRRQRLAVLLSQLDHQVSSDELDELADKAVGVAQISGELRVFCRTRDWRFSDLTPTVMLVWEAGKETRIAIREGAGESYFG